MFSSLASAVKLQENSLTHTQSLRCNVVSKRLRRDVSHCGEHRDTSVLQLRLAAALEVLHAAVGGESGWIKESDRILHTKLILERTQRRRGVVGPITPRGSGQSILEEPQYIKSQATQPKKSG